MNLNNLCNQQIKIKKRENFFTYRKHQSKKHIVYLQSKYLNYNYYTLSQQMQKEQKRAFSTIMFCFFACLAIFNVPFIVLNLIYAAQGNPCTTIQVPNISFTLKTWLQVDAYMRIAFLALFLLVAIVACCSIECAGGILICTMLYLCVYSIFQLVWLIIGAVMFWGHLNNQQGCSETPVATYMFVMLIIGFVGISSNCIFGGRNKNQGI